MREQYMAQTRLLLDVLPIVGTYEDFALKGGTALNYFLHDMPRLSVDIDLQYLPITSYEEAQQNIHEQMESLRSAVNNVFTEAHCTYLPDKYRILVRYKGVDIKIETNDVIRGFVVEPAKLNLCEKASQEFGVSLQFNCLSEAELYAGKLVAALDRQHPRDLFDMRFLLNKSGVLSRQIVEVFIVYLAGSKGSIREILDPRLKDITETFKKKFEGMTDTDIDLGILIQMQSQLAGIVRSMLTSNDKEFLLGFKRGSPDWNLLPFSNISDLPAVKWKMVNLDKMDSENRRTAIDRLAKILV